MILRISGTYEECSNVEREGSPFSKTYSFLLGSHDLGPAILLVRLRWSIRRSVLLQAAFHAVDGAPADFQAAVDGRGVYACFQELDDLLLDLGALLAAAGHCLLCLFCRVGRLESHGFWYADLAGGPRCFVMRAGWSGAEGRSCIFLWCCGIYGQPFGARTTLPDWMVLRRQPHHGSH